MARIKVAATLAAMAAMALLVPEVRAEPSVNVYAFAGQSGSFLGYWTAADGGVVSVSVRDRLAPVWLERGELRDDTGRTFTVRKHAPGTGEGTFEATAPIDPTTVYVAAADSYELDATVALPDGSTCEVAITWRIDRPAPDPARPTNGIHSSGVGTYTPQGSSARATGSPCFPVAGADAFWAEGSHSTYTWAFPYVHP